MIFHMTKSTGLFSLIILTVLLASGCATVTHGPNQRIPISSTPEGATVRVDGEWIGTTPLSANLSRKRAHQITIDKDYFRPETVTLRTVPNEATQRKVRFGIDELVGAHTDLEPSVVTVALDPVILPDQIGENGLTELTLKVLEIDDLLEEGEIDRGDHRYILSRLLEFYQR